MGKSSRLTASREVNSSRQLKSRRRIRFLDRIGIGKGLGRCPKCMRTSFLTMAAAIGLAAVATIYLHSDLAYPGWLIAAGFVALWISHLIAYAARRLGHAIGNEASCCRQVAWDRRASLFDQSRRKFLYFIKAAGFAAMATAMPRAISFAQDGTDCCDPSPCPPEFPKCFYNPSKDECGCCGEEETPCSSEKLSWCCPKGENCYGDEGGCY